MTINEIIINRMAPIVGQCVPNVYTGDAAEYSTFNYIEIPQVTAENGPSAIRYSVQLHWFLPNGKNPIAKKKLIKREIFSAGGTFPIVTDASDNICQHFVFEFSILGEGDI